MTVFIQHRNTGDYLSAEGKWVPEARAALTFARSTDAFNHCLEHSLADCDILLHFGGSQPDVRLPYLPVTEARTPTEKHAAAAPPRRKQN